MRLVLRELFEFGVMQTDPNFGNYRIQPQTGRLVLLDFGAARPIEAVTIEGYRQLLRAGLSGDHAAARTAAVAAGFLSQAAVARHGARVDAMIGVVMAELGRPGRFDFGDRRFVGALRDPGLEIAADAGAWHLPPADILFVQRKISGTALLAARLRARIDIRGLVAPWIGDPPTG